MAHPEWVSKRSHNNVPPEVALVLDSYYWHRAMLQVVQTEYTNGPQLSIMTYNLLSSFDEAQYRSPHLPRQEVCLNEILRYNPDIACLQEVVNLPWFRKTLYEYGYTLVAAHPNKHQALAIAFKTSLFTCTHHSGYHLALEDEVDPIHEHLQYHGALFVCLAYNADFLRGHRAPQKRGIIAGTTHLPLRKLKSYDRTKKAAALLRAYNFFAGEVGEGPDEFYSFIAGDFNSIPDEATYTSMVSKPVCYTRYAHDMLIKSMEDNWSMDSVIKTPKTLKTVGVLEKLHNSIPLRAFSLYSVAYALVDGNYVQPGCLEPWFSHWGKNTSQQLFDYIFAITPWDGQSSTQIEYLEEFVDATSMKILALLQMPIHEDMGGGRNPQPSYGLFPSDHVCMMAELELL